MTLGYSLKRQITHMLKDYDRNIHVITQLTMSENEQQQQASLLFNLEIMDHMAAKFAINISQHCKLIDYVILTFIKLVDLSSEIYLD